ncbi:CD63 antigen-like [Diorhabda carinulata]|uniref:CD63 antigen-like n=1 Tax=Diorhabda carinulata TaxID=1163345 RepID=UPI0025A0B610|nr:CD63 antigen-like [Diorhabda carinulata]
MDLATFMRGYSRYMLIIFNLIFVITGVVIISVGISSKAYFHEFDKLMDNKYFYISDLLIVIGVVIFLIAFFGCCGAIKENACMTTTYSTLLVIIFVLELTVGIVAVVLKGDVEQFLDNRLHETMKQYGNKTFNETTAIWDAVQNQFKCCGVDNYTDWYNILHNNIDLPLSCCKIPPGSTSFTCNSNNTYKVGCLQEFGDFVSYNISYVEGIGIGLAVIQLLGIIFSCCLSKFIRSDYETV